MALPSTGAVFLSVRDGDKKHAAPLARALIDLGFDVISTQGTADYLGARGIEVETIPKLQEGLRPNIIDRIKNREVSLIMNTPTGRGPRLDEARMRMEAVMRGVPVITTISGARAAVAALEALAKRGLDVRALQDYHEDVKRARR